MADCATLLSGDKMPLVGLGTWKTAEPNVVGTAVKTALTECGYKHVDCAHIYGNEEEVGAAFKGAFAEGVKREDIFITSKLWISEKHPEDVRPALLLTLKHLGLAYLDLYLIHWPVCLTKDAEFPPKPQHFCEGVPTIDTWREMEKLVDEGLVRNIGVSNFTTVQLERLWREARIKPAVNQVEMHPLLQQAKLREYCRIRGIHVTAFSPLGSNDSPMRGQQFPNLLENPTILAVASKHGRTAAQVILRWGVQHGVTVIPKSVRKQRITENKQITDFTLDADDMAAIAAEDKHARTCGAFFFNGKTSEEFWDNE
eukprot:TRINITY_DN462_c1_g3_i2.p2 TRINITY_DN462_c1_g3~~TRINITY_DN462_c1_g3_i2.p2  ORF type:complete len:313 (-),score=113.99 TRINITY_DN462_c1_g3_i2:30-968(-)